MGKQGSTPRVRPVSGAVGVLLAPNPSEMTLTGTNTWVIGEPGGACVVVDPGPLEPDHVDAVAGLDVRLVLLTHHHLDHAEAVDAVHRATGAVVRARDPDLCRSGAPLTPGETIDAVGVTIEVVATPGHTADSTCFVLPAERAVLTGDTILGAGTSVVAHPDGRLDHYLASLRLLAGADGMALLPGHGPEGADCGESARAYLAHRQVRLAQVRAALAAGARDAEEVVAIVYADVDRVLWPAAQRSVQAQLVYLASRERP